MSDNTADKVREVGRFIAQDMCAHISNPLKYKQCVEYRISQMEPLLAFAAEQAAAARLAEAKLRPHDSTCEQALINPRHILCLCGRNQRIAELERLPQRAQETKP